MNKFDAAANLAFFLLEKTGSVLGRWTGRMNAKDQRALFGAYLGKGLLVIDGAAERVTHTVSACFGLDYDVTADRAWIDVQQADRAAVKARERSPYMPA